MPLPHSRDVNALSPHHPPPHFAIMPTLHLLFTMLILLSFFYHATTPPVMNCIIEPNECQSAVQQNQVLSRTMCMCSHHAQGQGQLGEA